MPRNTDFTSSPGKVLSQDPADHPTTLRIGRSDGLKAIAECISGVRIDLPPLYPFFSYPSLQSNTHRSERGAAVWSNTFLAHRRGINIPVLFGNSAPRRRAKNALRYVAFELSPNLLEPKIPLRGGFYRKALLKNNES